MTHETSTELTAEELLAEPVAELPERKLMRRTSISAN